MKHFKHKIFDILFIALFFAIICLPNAYSQSNKTVRVGFFQFDGYHIDDGEKSGYGYEYLQNMAIYTDWVYEYKGYDKSWAEVQTMLENGEIDILTSAQKTSERLKKFDYSSSEIGSSATIITVKAGNTKYYSKNFNEFDGIRVGMIKNNSRNSSFFEFAKKNNFYSIPVYFNSIAELEEALQNGEKIDAIVTSNLRSTKNEWIVAEFDVSPFYVIVKKGNEELLSQVNYAISQLQVNNPSLQTELFRKYYSVDNSNFIPFNSEERQFIENFNNNKQKLNVLVQNAELPLLFVDKDNNASGIFPDILAEIKKLSNLDFNLITVNDSKTYEEQLKSSNIDIILDAESNYSKAEKYNYKITAPYLELAYAYVEKKENHKYNSFLYTPYFYFDKDKLSLESLNINASSCNTETECIDNVLAGKADFALINSLIANRALLYDITNSLSVRIVPNFSKKISIGVINSNETVLLISILSKAINYITSNSIANIVNLNTDYESPKIDFKYFLYTKPLVVVLFVVIFFIIIIFVIYSANRIKAQKEAEERENEYVRFISYVCKINDEVLEVDLQKDIRYEYKVFGKCVKKSSSEFNIEKRINDTVHPDDAAELRNVFKYENLVNLIMSQSEQSGEVRIKVADGSYHYFSFVLHGMAKDNEHPKNIMIFKRDIEKIKNDERQKRQALEDALHFAELASAAKGNFLSRMSHEIRTPLNAVIGYLAIAQKNKYNIDKVDDCIAKSNIAARHLLGVINDVLDASAIENGKMKIAEEEFDFRQLISLLTEMFYTQAKSKGVGFETYLSNITNEILVGDQLRLNQILMNILSNAIKFTPKGGKIYFSITELTSHNNKTYMRFEITDTGIGIKKEFLENLWKPFEQANAKIASTYGGSGLGLSITKNLVTMMKGTIDVDSTENAGSKFTVELPFKMVENSEFVKKKHDFSNIHALIIDDEQNACDYMSLLFDRCGVRNTTVLNGNKAIEELIKYENTDPYDIILMDWKMPEIDGLETVHLIRKKLSRDLPIIIVTSYDFTEIEQEAKSAGVDYIVSKPLFQSTIFNLLVNTYGKYKPKYLGAEKHWNFKNKRLLLAEDNEMNREIATDMLESAGFVIDSAENGQKALEMFANSENDYYCAILMDIIMPIMDGHEATRKIRALDKADAKTIPIIAMTANAFTEDVSLALQSGMNNHIAKPIDVDQLFKTLSAWIK